MEDLDLSFNKIKFIEDFKFHQNMQKINLTHNKIKLIPTEIIMPNLKSFSAKENKIKSDLKIRTFRKNPLIYLDKDLSFRFIK